MVINDTTLYQMESCGQWRSILENFVHVKVWRIEFAFTVPTNTTILNFLQSKYVCYKFISTDIKLAIISSPEYAKGLSAQQS